MRTNRSQSSHRLGVLASRAAAMRSAPTTAEALLWRALSGSRLGVAFRRQVVLGEHIADFYCAEARLVVEVDGGYHAGRAAADARRDRALSKLGCRVLRLPNELVLQHFPQAIAAVLTALTAT